MHWNEAKTYAKTAPHEYIMRKDEPELFEYIGRMIKKHGIYENFTLHGKVNRYKYYYRGNYKYWIIWNVLNRVKINKKK